MRAGLVELLSGEASTAIAGQARTGREVVERARRLEPEVLLTDARMPDVDSSA
jgi:YesN/AraC family two-component response regulator